MLKNATLFRKVCTLALCAVFFPSTLGAQQDLADGLYASMETTRGTILLRLEYERAPLTVTNFVGLAEGTLAHNRGEGVRFYDGITFLV